MKWRDLTSAELDRLDRDIPVVLSVAAIEQHGPHLPLSTDAIIGEHFLDRIEALRGDRVLVLPQMQVGCSHHHMDFPGSLTLSHETFLSMATDIVGSVDRWGFRNIVLLNSHGGNQAIGQVVVEKLGPRLEHSNLVFATWWRLAAEALGPLNQTGPLGIGHACEFETSLMLHIDPGSVRHPIPGGEHYRRSHDWSNGGMLQGARATHYRSVRDISGGNGVVGTPLAATAEKGGRISHAVCTALDQMLASFAFRPPGGPASPLHPEVPA